MAEYISRDDVLRKFIEGDGHDDERFTEGYNFAVQEHREEVKKIPAADVKPINHSEWCPPLMGQGKCDTYCGRCFGKIMRNSTGIFEETPFCPHCGARMDGDTE